MFINPEKKIINMVVARRRTCFSASLLFLVFISSLAIKNRYFCQPDGVIIYTNLIWLLKRHIFIRRCSLERYMKDLHTGEERVPFVYHFYYVVISKCVRDLKSQV